MWTFINSRDRRSRWRIKNFKYVVSPHEVALKHPLWILIIILVVDMNFLPRRVVCSFLIHRFFFISNTIKSTSRIILSICSRKLSVMPLGYLMDVLPNWRDMVWGFNSPKPRWKYNEYGMRSIPAHKSSITLNTFFPPKIMLILKLPWSFWWCGNGIGDWYGSGAICNMGG